MHNEAACDLLFRLSEGQFNDWVVTTAFYSALHFALYDLFPYEYNGICYTDFSEYHLSLRKRVSKHKAIIRLVSTSPYAREYRWLYANCMYARYTDYRISTGKAVFARQMLSSLKAGISKPA